MHKTPQLMERSRCGPLLEPRVTLYQVFPTPNFEGVHRRCNYASIPVVLVVLEREK